MEVVHPQAFQPLKDAQLSLMVLVMVQESTHFDGQVLVAREAEGHQTGGASHVVDTYEPVAGTIIVAISPINITITVIEITTVVVTVVIICVIYIVADAEVTCSQAACVGS